MSTESGKQMWTVTGAKGRPRDVSDESVSDGERITVRLTPSLGDEIDALVENGAYPNKTEVVRKALRQFVDNAEASDGGKCDENQD